jgi:hypothetical protein
MQSISRRGNRIMHIDIHPEGEADIAVAWVIRRMAHRKTGVTSKVTAFDLPASHWGGRRR